MVWATGDVIVTRQVWRGRVIAGFPVTVLEATDDHLVTYIAPGTEFGFVDGAYPGPGGRHPWQGRPGWQGHGMVKVVPTRGWVAVQHFWVGDDRDFACWYLNIQEPMRPTPIGYDSQDLELDIVVAPDGSWVVKDDDLLDQRVAEGRWTPAEAAEIRRIGEACVRDVLEPGRWWWSRDWATWEPHDGLTAQRLPDGWADVPPAPFAGIPTG